MGGSVNVWFFFIFDHENQFFCYYGPCLSKKWPRICLYSVILLSEAISTIYFWLWPVVLKISVIFWIFRPFAMYLKIAKVWKKSQLYQFLVQLGQNRLQKRIQHQKTRFPGIFQVFSGTIRWVMTSLRVFGVSGWPKLIAYPENWKTHKKSKDCARNESKYTRKVYFQSRKRLEPLILAFLHYKGPFLAVLCQI